MNILGSVIIGIVYFLLYRKFLWSISLFGRETAGILFMLAIINTMVILIRKFVFHKETKLWSTKTLLNIIIGTAVSFVVFICGCVIWFIAVMHDFD